MSHLTLEQRYIIFEMKDSHSLKEIGEKIGKDKSVISRELKRNCDKRSGTYRAELAHKKYTIFLAQKAKKTFFTFDIKKHIDEKLEKKYSPEQIVGEAKEKNIACVSIERIYQYIWEDKKRGGKLHENLRRKGKKYRKRGDLKDSRGILPNKKNIAERPEIVNSRERFGDFEIDTIIGKDHKGAILTINERKTGFVKIAKLSGKNAQEVSKKTIEILWKIKPFIHTITSDNGKEFALHEDIEKALEIDFFFANPYCSWERGSNENLNGLIRQYIPKKTDFDTISDDYIQFIEDELNNRPRKRFKFNTPLKLFNKHVAFVN